MFFFKKISRVYLALNGVRRVLILRKDTITLEENIDLIASLVELVCTHSSIDVQYSRIGSFYFSYFFLDSDEFLKVNLSLLTHI